MKKIVISLIIIIILFLLILQFIPIGIEPLTQVYFNSHEELPNLIHPNKYYNFSFTINNLEYQKMHYNYSVLIIDKLGDHNLINTNIIELKNNESREVSISFSLEPDFMKNKIFIKVDKIKVSSGSHENKFWWFDSNYPESMQIHFWTHELD